MFSLAAEENPAMACRNAGLPDDESARLRRALAGKHGKTQRVEAKLPFLRKKLKKVIFLFDIQDEIIRFIEKTRIG